MAKAKTRKRGTGRGGATRSRSGHTVQTTTPSPATNRDNGPASGSAQQKRPGAWLRSLGTSGLLSTGMVALGCWGMAIFFFFLYPDPNHVLFGCIAALMALMWSYSFGARISRGRRLQHA